MNQEALNVLCVDDDDELLRFVAASATEAGFVPITTTNPTAVVELLARHHRSVALIISDFKMPGLDGFALRRRLAEGPYRDIPFAVLTGHATREMALAAVDLGITAFLSKPLDRLEMTRVLKDKTAERVEQIRERQTLEECFLDEASELMEELEPQLLALEERGSDQELLAAIFRNVHTIKGSSGVLGRAELTQLLHTFEDILSQLKNGVRIATPHLVTGLLAAFDTLGRTLRALRGGGDLPDLPGATLALKQASTETTVGAGVANTAAKAAAAGGPATADAAADASSRGESVSVPTVMLDEFMRLTGETTVLRNMINKLVGAIERRMPGDEDVELLSELLEEMHKINAVMQTRIAELRKTPMTQILKKLPRTVRDIGKQLDKKLRLVTSGESLRVDTAIAQALNNSLIHMVRNSADHGIESAAVRMQRGKPAEGTVSIACREVADCVIVEIADDGGGIDPEKIRGKLRDAGRLEPTVIEAMSRDALLRQIFHSGFSTAAAITDVSGRGVGMDMVRTSIERLKGRIDIASEVGKGTKFTFVMPVPKSVVIISSLLVGAGGRSFAISHDDIVRLLRVDRSQRSGATVDLGGAYGVVLDGALVPLISLRQALGLGEHDLRRDDEDLNVVIVRWDHGVYGVVVDSIHDAEDTVVKSLHGVVERIGVFSGATFLGDGTVGLIIDVSGLARLAGLAPDASEDVATAATSDTGAITTVGAPDPGELMLFELQDAGIYGLPLERVYRLEELPPEDVVKVGERVVAKYRESLTPVVMLDKTRDRGSMVNASGTISAIMLTAGDRLFAAPVARVLEIGKLSAAIEPVAQARRGIKGMTTVDGRIITVLDLDDLLAADGIVQAAPRPAAAELRLVRSGDASPAQSLQTETATIEPQPSQPEAAAADAGWGLF